MRLDIGCGNRPTGNVNCDLYIGPSPHHGISSLDVTKIPNFVKCDARFLPFKDNSFGEVYASHLLEHFETPSEILIEMLRVAADLVTIITPHRMTRKGWFRYRQDAVHKQFFDGRTFQEWLDRKKLAYTVQVKMKPFPNDIIPIFHLPWEIHVEVRKG